MATSPIERGKRLQYIRAIAELTREELSKLAGVGHSSIKYWEDGKGAGITTRAAKKLIAAFNAEHIECTISWLMEGLGSAPISKILQPIHTSVNDLQPELNLLQANQKNLVVFKIENNDLYPICEVGDTVCAILEKKTEKEIGQLVKKLAIIEQEDRLICGFFRITESMRLFQIENISGMTLSTFKKISRIGKVIRIYKPDTV